MFCAGRAGSSSTSPIVEAQAEIESSESNSREAPRGSSHESPRAADFSSSWSNSAAGEVAAQVCHKSKIHTPDHTTSATRLEMPPRALRPSAAQISTVAPVRNGFSQRTEAGELSAPLRYFSDWKKVTGSSAVFDTVRNESVDGIDFILWLSVLHEEEWVLTVEKEMEVGATVCDCISEIEHEIESYP